MNNARITLVVIALVACVMTMAQPPLKGIKMGKPTKEELTMTTYEADKDAVALVLLNKKDVYYDVNARGLVTFWEVKRRVKVLKEEGKEAANYYFDYYCPESGGDAPSVSGLKATAYNMVDGKVVATKMKNDMVFKERLSPSMMRIKITVPQVVVGTVIEIEYKLQSVYYDYLPNWYAQSEYPTLYAEYDMMIPDWFQFNFDQRGMTQLQSTSEEETQTLNFNGISESVNCNHYKFYGHNLEAMKTPDYVWCPSDFSAQVNTDLRSLQLPGQLVKVFTLTWQDIDKRLINDEDFGGRMRKSNPLKDDMTKAGIYEMEDTLQKMIATYQLLMKRVKWNGNYALWGSKSGDVLKQGTGDNADINFILIRMLRDAGMTAQPIVMSRRDRPRTSVVMPDLGALNTFVVAVPIGGKVYYIDASCELGYPNALPPVLLPNQVHVVNPDAQYGWTNIQSVSNSITNVSIRAKLLEDGVLTGNLVEARTMNSALDLRTQFKNTTDSAALVASRWKDFEISDYQIEGHRSFGRGLREEFNFTKSCSVMDGKIFLMPLVDEVMTESPFTEEKRTLPVEFPYLHNITVTSEITIPDGYVVEDVSSGKIQHTEDNGMSWQASTSVDGNVVKTMFRFNLRKCTFLSDEYGTVRQMMANIAEHNSSMITIRKQ